MATNWTPQLLILLGVGFLVANVRAGIDALIGAILGSAMLFGFIFGILNVIPLVGPVLAGVQLTPLLNRRRA